MQLSVLLIYLQRMTVTNPFIWQGICDVYLAYTGSHYMLLGTGHKVKGGWAGKNRGWVTIFEHG